MSGRVGRALEQGSAQNQKGHCEVNDQAGHIDQRSHKRSGSRSRIKAYPSQCKWQH